MTINAYLEYLQLFKDHLLLGPLLLCDTHNLQDCAYIWNKCASCKTLRYVSIGVAHSISCPVDKANPWGMLLSNHIYPHCTHCWELSPYSAFMVSLYGWANTVTGCSWQGWSSSPAAQTQTSMSMLPATSFCTFPWARTGARLTPKRTGSGD